MIVSPKSLSGKPQLFPSQVMGVDFFDLAKLGHISPGKHRQTIIGCTKNRGAGRQAADTGSNPQEVDSLCNPTSLTAVLPRPAHVSHPCSARAMLRPNEARSSSSQENHLVETWTCSRTAQHNLAAPAPTLGSTKFCSLPVSWPFHRPS